MDKLRIYSHVLYRITVTLMVKLYSNVVLYTDIIKLIVNKVDHFLNTKVHFNFNSHANKHPQILYTYSLLFVWVEKQLTILRR